MAQPKTLPRSDRQTTLKTVNPPQRPEPFYCERNQRHPEKVAADLNLRRIRAQHRLSEDKRQTTDEFL